MNLVGELVLTRNQLVQISGAIASSPLQAASGRLSQITTELQDRVMKTRVQPIDVVWSKLPRTVRELASLCGKKVRLEMEGTETELDRSVIDAIRDPMTHLLRNSIDHGIELPGQRLAAGKPEEGTILLRAYHAAGLVTIEITDDGGGINVERVKARALERGIISPEDAEKMSHKDLVHLIFQPGFSTAEKVSMVSGRGVGMDVVKTHIEKIGGIVDLSTELGKGTTCRIKIPLTLAIIPVVIVGCRQERFAVPQANLLEVIRIDDSVTLETVRDTQVARLRGTLMPVVRLQEALQLRGPAPKSEQHLALVQAGPLQFGLIVDSIHEAEEIVVKPMGRALMSLPCFAGSTILGDGRVALILDVFGIANRANLLGEGSNWKPSREEMLVNSEPRPEEHKVTELLIFKVGGTRAAIPLEMVHRLEEFPSKDIEHCAGRTVIQYNGEILPLISVARNMGLPETTEDPSIVQAVIYQHEKHPVGLMIESVDQIIKDSVVLQTTGRRFGVLGSAVIGKKVTEFVDVPGMLQRLFPEFGSPQSPSSSPLSS
jgi:two-component system chemotaxis sensor kinase CheA